MKKKRTIIETFRLTENEFSQLTKEFVLTDFKKKSEFYRYKILLKLDHNLEMIKGESLNDELAKLNFQINKIGNNINQIAKSVNSKNIDSAIGLDLANKELVTIVDIISKIRHI